MEGLTLADKANVRLFGMGLLRPETLMALLPEALMALLPGAPMALLPLQTPLARDKLYKTLWECNYNTGVVS
jgi:hypothetical protein